MKCDDILNFIRKIKENCDFLKREWVVVDEGKENGSGQRENEEEEGLLFR